MGLWSALTGNSDTRSGQQRRAKAVRAADRAGQARIDAKRSSQSITAWNREQPRAWWRSS